MFRKAFLTVVMGLGFLGFESSAWAGLKFKNYTSETIYIAVTNFEAGGWRADGWYKVEPRQTFEVMSGDLTHRYYYFYAYTASKQSVWEGNYPFWIHPTNGFTILHVNGAAGALPLGAQRVGFRQIDTGPTARDYTLNLY